MLALLKTLSAAGIIMCATACGTTKVVFVDTQADLVRLGPDVRERSMSTGTVSG